MRVTASRQLTYDIPNLNKLSMFHWMPSRSLADGAERYQHPSDRPADRLFDSNQFSLTCTNFVYYSCPDARTCEDASGVNPRTAMFGTGCNLTPPTPCANHYFFDPSSFTDNALGTLGNTTRNFFHGPGFWNTDFALRSHQDYEGTSFEMRFEAFNLLNHVNFANPIGDVADPISAA